MDPQQKEKARQYGPGGLVLPGPDMAQFQPFSGPDHTAYGSLLRPRGPYAPGMRDVPVFPPPPQQRPPQCKVLPFLGSGGSRAQGVGLRGDFFVQPHASASFDGGHSAQPESTSMCTGKAGLPADDGRKASEEFLRLLAAKERVQAMHDRGDLRHRADHHGAVFDGCRRRSQSQGRSSGRSGTRSRSGSRSRGISGVQSRSHGKSRGRSWSRPRSRSRGKSRGRSRSRGKSRGRSRSRLRSGSPSVQVERSSNNSTAEVLQKLQLAHRHKELEKLLLESRRFILQKQDSLGEGAVEQLGGSLSAEAKRFLHAIAKRMETGLLASVLGEGKEVTREESRETLTPGLKQSKENAGSIQRETWSKNSRDSLLPHEKVRQDGGGFSRILGFMGDSPGPRDRKRSFTDVEDEERFLYGDEEERDDPGSVQSQHWLATRGDTKPKIDELTAGKLRATGRPAVEDTKKLQSLLKTVGLGIGVPEASRTASKLQGDRVWPRKGPISVTVPGWDVKVPVGKSFGDALGEEGFRNRSVTACQPPPGTLADPPTVVQSVLPLFPAYLAPSRELTTLEQPPKSATVLGVAKMDTTESGSNQSQREEGPPEESRKEEAVTPKSTAQVEIEKEYHVLELRRLLRRQGCDFIIPVVGFYCQLCEEFLGDPVAAKDHAGHHLHGESLKKHAAGGHPERKQDGKTDNLLPDMTLTKRVVERGATDSSERWEMEKRRKKGKKKKEKKKKKKKKD